MIRLFRFRYAPGGRPGRPEGSDGVPSWNHIMYGAITEWFFAYLAGIQQADGSRGWATVKLRPTVWNPWRGESICANLSSAEASFLSPRGQIRVAWKCGGGAHPTPPPPPPSPYPQPGAGNSLCPAGGKRLGGNAIEKWDRTRDHEIGGMTLTCTDGGKIASIDFASFGTPTGNCTAGFTASPKCEAEGVRAKIESACVGRSNCTLIASFRAFGDPCAETIKSLAVLASGCSGVTVFTSPPPPPPPPTPLFEYEVTVPTGSIGHVHMPTMGHPNASLYESDTLVWEKSQWVPGVDGIESVVSVRNGTELVVVIGSGSYSFTIR